MKLYNTLTKQPETIEKKDHLNLYTCGPTVYNYAHIGNLRTYISADLLYRTLKYQGYNPRWVMNITDIDDKTIRGTVEKYGQDATVENLREFTEFYLRTFLKDLDEVNVLKDEINFIRVTDVIPQIQEFIIKLIDKGYAYKAEDGVYFSIEKYQKDFGDYGGLVGEKFLEGKKVGARVKVDEYEKDNLSDFALWKAHNPETDANIFWEHPVLGKGRPGWHIECSVINQVAFKGEPTDIHTGAVDLIFPHHTNEIAQSQALLGKGSFVKHWSHAEHLLVDGKRMGKSNHNFYILKDLAGKIPLTGLTLRYLFLQSGYRTQQNFTMESFIGSYKALEKLYNILKSHKIIGEQQKVQEGFFDDMKAMLLNDDFSALGNDLNYPAILSFVWGAFATNAVSIHTQDRVIEEFNKVLGLKLDEPPEILQSIQMPKHVQELVVKRHEAKEQKDFAKADFLRQQIEAEGYEVMDTPDGQKVKKKI